MSILWILPYELLLEIASYLSVPDLYHLILTSRPAHEYFNPSLYSLGFRDEKSAGNRQDVLCKAARSGLIQTIKNAFWYGSPAPYPAHACLGQACIQGNLEIVRFLLDQRVSPQFPGGQVPQWERNLLFLAIMGRHRGIVHMLLQAGADPNHDAPGIFEKALYAYSNPKPVDLLDILIEGGLDIHQHHKSGNRFLHHIVLTGSMGGSEPFWRLDYLSRLLDRGVDVNYRGRRGLTVLSMAITWGSHPEVVTLLLNHGARLDIPDIDGNLPIHLAAMGLRYSYIPQLIAAGAGSQINSRNTEGRTPLYLTVAPWEGRARANVDAMRDLLHAGADITAPSDLLNDMTIVENVIESGVLPTVRLLLDAGLRRIPVFPPSELLLAASCVGDVTTARQLLARGDVDIMHRSNGLKHTALIIAAHHGQDEIISVLFDRMSPAQIDTRNTAGSTAVHESVRLGKKSTVRLVLGRSNPLSWNVFDAACETPLSIAVKSGDIDAMRLLLAHGACVNPRPVSGSRSPLDDAVRLGRLAIVDLLLDHGAELEYENGDGKRVAVLMEASHNDDLAMVKLLVSRGAPVSTQVLASTSYWGDNYEAAYLSSKTALALAAAIKERNINVATRNLDVARYLLEAGADPNVPAMARTRFDEPESFTKTPLLISAIQTQDTELVDLLLTTSTVTLLDLDASGSQINYTALTMATRLSNLGFINRLLRHGANPNCRDGPDDRGQTPLEWAAYTGAIPTIEVLLGHKDTIVDLENPSGMTPLMLAAKGGKVESAQVLFRLGNADIRHRNHRGETALMLAANLGHADVVQWLLNQGVEVDAVDNLGSTALCHALTRSENGAIEVLVNAGADMGKTENNAAVPVDSGCL